MGEATTITQPDDRTEDEAPAQVRTTACCVVGGGPAGAMLAFLLARQGVEVTLLEGHTDFDRDFRGDTLHPSVLEVLDSVGLADRLHELEHTKVTGIPVQTAEGPLLPVDLGRLRTPYHYIMLVPQARFLEFLTAEAARYPTFSLVMGASVRRLVIQDGVVRGVRYRARDGWHEVRAGLTVATDGRSSKVRSLAGLEPRSRTSHIDVLWFRLPRLPDEPGRTFGVVRPGHFLAVLQRPDHWQVAYLLRKGDFPQLRAAGLGELRHRIASALPAFARHAEHLTDWKQVSLLSVQTNRVPTWHRPGLLLLGDAAHAMSPVMGVGINYAIGDAVVAANLLTRPLLAWQRRGVAVPRRRLAAVQRRRELPIRFIQAVQRVQERALFATVAGGAGIPPLARRVLALPGVRRMVARVVGVGLWRVKVRTLR